MAQRRGVSKPGTNGGSFRTTERAESGVNLSDRPSNEPTQPSRANRVAPNRLTQDEVLARFERQHGQRYDYSEVAFSTMKEKVTIICRSHGPFRQVPYAHAGGKGCPRCKADKQIRRQRRPRGEFIDLARRVHPDSHYSYDKVEYLGALRHVLITCAVHGDFRQTPAEHLSGRGCKPCGDVTGAASRSLSTAEFVDRSRAINGDTFTYERANYVRAMQPIVLTCRVHGDFTTTPNRHLNGAGCPKCRESRGERYVRVALERAGVAFIREFSDPSLQDSRTLRFDFALPEQRCLIEFDGPQHHSADFYRMRGAADPERALAEVSRHDKMKDDWAERNGWRLIRLTQWRTVEADLTTAGILPS